MEKESGTLFVVSTPIGNHDDITLRAIETLKKSDIVICEEAKVGARLLHVHRVNKPIEELNEHNEAEQNEVLLEKLRRGSTLALVSDCGTPLLADPGSALVRRALQEGLEVRAVPGVSSITAALVTSGLPMEQFLFAGFLSRIPVERLEQVERLAVETRTVVVLETPYRMVPLLRAAAQVMPERRAYLGCNLTMPSETHHYGTFKELLEKFEKSRFKGEFVLCFHGAAERREPLRRQMRSSARKFPSRRRSPAQKKYPRRYSKSKESGSRSGKSSDKPGDGMQPPRVRRQPE